VRRAGTALRMGEGRVGLLNGSAGFCEFVSGQGEGSFYQRVGAWFLVERW
jgi:hypothetical protein